jgi:hypothetical protein
VSDLFRNLKATEQCYRKRRVLITGIKVYIRALRLDDGELLILASPQFNSTSRTGLCFTLGNRNIV